MKVLRDYDPPTGVAISSLEYNYPAGHEVPLHAHGSAQLIYASHGVMQIFAEGKMWVIPPQFALWLPAATSHNIRMPGAVSMRTLYLRPRLVARMPACAVLHVSSLLRELIMEAIQHKHLRKRGAGGQGAVVELIARELQRAKPVPAFISMPRDQRALAVAQRIVDAPHQSLSLAVLCKNAGAGVRTVERLFQQELGCGFRAWRRQVRLTRGIELLAAGASVKEVAHAVGYNQPSAFVEAFRLTFGDTPKAWMMKIQPR